MNIKVTRPDPRDPLNKDKKMSLYHAAALGQFKSAERGNSLAWKEIQDTLHGPMPTKIEGQFDFTFSSLAKEAALELGEGEQTYDAGSNGSSGERNGHGPAEGGYIDIEFRSGHEGANGSNGTTSTEREDIGGSEE
jgi:hypothetical protein